ncbi:cytochrome C [Geobacter sp. FeAm09]|uniref:cytochrome C n=1 Tax=Geobacter sp. FeAm09 TaxID=2597769 RepID=UPI0011EF9458|nr:cytochrome C [Geobacter sp. FeAm09]QEM69961.1 cytochrome C [Geobacter sp. FeAm09]
MKRIVLILALLGFGLVCLQQRSYADKKMSHTEYAKMAIKECNDCHKGEGIAPNHDADFVRGHRVLASRAGNNCSQCHDQAWCLDCHQGGGTGDSLSQSNAGRDYKPKTHRSDWISMHPIKAQDNQQQCYRCHDQKYCTACHSKLPQTGLKSLGFKSHDNQQGARWGMEHSGEARRNLQACQTCHADGNTCKKCHSSGGVSPHPRGFKAGNYKDRSNSKVCLQCHLPGRF